MQQRPCVLSIAGLDPSGGAGLLADIKTFEQLNVYGFGVASALTVQDDREVYKTDWLEYDDIIEQADVLFKRFDIRVCKIGIMPSAEAVNNLVNWLKSKNNNIKIVVDTVLQSTSGFNFMQGTEEQEWIKLLKNVTLITPNYTEMQKIAEATENIEKRALNWSEYGAILIKGGHNPDSPGTDILYTQGTKQEIQAFSEQIAPKHGSGCVLSSAIAAYLALGFSLPDACLSAKKYTERFLNSNSTLLGFHQHES